MAMEACVRGFSYMPESIESKLEVSLQFIEDEELERAWKVSRRQRVREQEQKIWEEFVKEQDIVQKAYSEDPYQFLQELPESCLKELMESELQKLGKESATTIVENSIQEQDDLAESGGGRSVTFSDEERAEENMDMFHIFDEENDAIQSGGDGDGDGDGDNGGDVEEDPPESPATVRERETEDPSPSPGAKTPPYHAPSADVSQAMIPVKSTDTVSNVIESSIYCARVKDIRLKISEEMAAIITSLEVEKVGSLERSEVTRRCRRAAEFCARFNRIYMYELQRQAHNIKRHVSQTPPLAQHTHFQAQMLRVVSLHQNMLQALQVIHKSFPATSCVRECARALACACTFVRDTSALCAHIRTPRDFPAATDLYNDELLVSCDKLEAAVREHDARVTHVLNSDNVHNLQLPTSPSHATSTSRTKKAKKYNAAKTGPKSWSTKDTDARLSMYSLDTLRGNLHARPSHSRGNTSKYIRCGSKGPRSPTAAGNKLQRTDKGPEKTNKKGSRRPLMRAPPSSAPRARHAKDMEITTMVEAVKTCTSSQAVSRAPSPREGVPRSHRLTPRMYNSTPRHPSPLPRGSPRPRVAQGPTKPASPRVKPHSPLSPRTTPQPKKSSTSIASDIVTYTATNKTSITPVTNIQCAKKQTEIEQKNKPEKTDRLNTDRSKNSEKIHSDRSKNFERVHTERSKYTERKLTDRSSYTERTKPHEKVYIRCSPRSQREKEDKMETEIDMLSNKMDEEGSEKEFCGVKELTDNNDDYAKAYLKEVEEEKCARSRSNMSSRCDVSWLLRQLCSGDPASLSKENKVTGAKNAQLLCIRGGSPPRQPSTPQLLRILEETIQKQAPKPMYDPHKAVVNTERFRLNLNIGSAVASRMFQYRTKFVQHMLTSPLYANSTVGKPWEMIGGVSDKIIDEVLSGVAHEMQIQRALRHLYHTETH